MTPLEKLLKRAASFVVHGGSWRLRSYEASILRAAAQALPAADADALRAQLDNLEHLKRLHSDRMVTFYFFEAARLPRLSSLEAECCISQFRVKSAGTQSVRASVYTHHGLLSSLEFSKSPSRIDEAAAFELQPMSGGSRSSITNGIDREEHT